MTITTPHSPSTNAVIRQTATTTTTRKTATTESANKPSSCNTKSAMTEFSSDDIADDEPMASRSSSCSSSWYLSDDSEDTQNSSYSNGDTNSSNSSSSCGIDADANDDDDDSNQSSMTEDGFNLTRLMQRVSNHDSSRHDPYPKLHLTTLLSVPWALDVGLSRVLPPIMLEQTETFLLTPRVVYTSNTASNDRLLYVAQAEVAHATVRECDILVSDRATTCHILAMYSYYSCCQRPTLQYQGQQGQQLQLPSAPLMIEESHSSASSSLSHHQARRQCQRPSPSSQQATSAASTSTSAAATQSSSSFLPLATMTHLDGTSYESCIRAMIQQHKRHHHHHQQQHSKTAGIHQHHDDPNNDHSDHHHQNDKIHMDLHIVGGYEDAQGSSRAISNWLLLLLLQLASEEQDTMVMKLRTCAMTCLNHHQHHDHKNESNTNNNDNTNNITNMTTMTTTSTTVYTLPCLVNDSSSRSTSGTDIETDEEEDETYYYTNNNNNNMISASNGMPRGRGLALDVRTGRVRLAHVADEALMGPLPALRAARLWANSNHQPPSFVPTLSVITPCCYDTDDETTTKKNIAEFTIAPFDFGPWDELDWLLTLPDDALLQQTSTSPEVEEDDYCRQVRASLELIRDWDAPTLFGPNCNRPLLFRRRLQQQPSSQEQQHDHDNCLLALANDWIWIPSSVPQRRQRQQSRSSRRDLV